MRNACTCMLKSSHMAIGREYVQQKAKTEDVLQPLVLHLICCLSSRSELYANDTTNTIVPWL